MYKVLLLPRFVPIDSCLLSFCKKMIEHEEWGLATVFPLHPTASRNVEVWVMLMESLVNKFVRIEL